MIDLCANPAATNKYNHQALGTEERMQRIGKYEITELLGQGGMGAVYRAHDPALQRPVAIKVLKLEAESLGDRFLQEARIVAGFRHPNIVTIYDFGVEDGRPYIVQEYLDGADLNEVLENNPDQLDLDDRTIVLLLVASGLAYAHDAGVVHRDIKPGNVRLLRDGGVKLLDFGIARLETARSELTQPGTVIGTMGYMSPESLRGSTMDQRADVFSFGALAYELLTGHRAFPGDSFPEVIDKIINHEVGEIPFAFPDCPETLARVVERCLRKAPQERFGSMDEVTVELRKARRELGFEPYASLLKSIEWGEPRAPKREGTTEPEPDGDAPPKAAGGTVVSPLEDLKGTKPTDLPAQVSRFTLHELVGEGRTGKLYRAYDPVRGELIGLKVLKNSDGLAQQRLLRDAKLWLTFDHPNLLKVRNVELGGVDRPPMIETELAEGVDLRKATAQRRFTLEQKISVVIQVCDALEHIHRHGVVHREVIPRNIVVSGESPTVKLLDSGIARRVESNLADLTRTGMIIGDLTYMAPEQMQNRTDQRSDVFSVGAVLYELIVGQTPTPHDIAAMYQRIERLGCPKRLKEAMQRALSEDPDNRYSRVVEFSDHLRELVPERKPPVSLSKVIATLHGIRTHAKWQRAFAEVATQAGLQCRLDRWDFGYFSVFRFLLPWPRRGRVLWFRRTYQEEFGSQVGSELADERPSIVAHSFGTYILGNALLRYPYLRFGKVLLCGSILPASFPWDALICKGQVQAVRNEYGARDIWTRLVQFFVPGTGPSGMVGFEVQHERLIQERFDFAHSEYFEKSHMESQWVPFLRSHLSPVTPHDVAIEPTTTSMPLALRALYVLLAGMLGFLVWVLLA